jgi:hypothetical protein
MRRIKLSQNRWATVDDRFYDALVAMGPWYFNDGYAVRSVRQKNGKRATILMHRAVMQLARIRIPNGFEVDHASGRRRDNRLCNLRLATQSQQMQNRPKSRNNSSGVKGVHWAKDAGKWWARINVNRKVISLGLFKSKREAAKAYRRAARKYFGEFARDSFDWRAA